jgi:putative hydrolase of the HAD superfamily
MAKRRLLRSITPLQPIPTGLTPSGDLKNKAKCLLFDVYGTLFISASGDIGTTQYQASQPRLMDILFDKYHIHKNPELMINGLLSSIEAEHVRLKEMGVDFPEVNIAEVWNHLLVGMPAETVRQFAEEFEHIVNPVCPMPHLKTILSKCRLKGIPMGIISNAQFYTPKLFEQFLGSDLKGLGFDPDLIFFSYCFGYAKPSTLLFEQARKKLTEKAISVDRTIFVGNDMLNDVYPAAESGFKTALFAGDKRSLRLREDNPKCQGLKPDLVITDLMQLIQVL